MLYIIVKCFKVTPNLTSVEVDMIFDKHATPHKQIVGNIFTATYQILTQILKTVFWESL